MRNSIADLVPYRMPSKPGVPLQWNTNRLGPSLSHFARLFEKIDISEYPDMNGTRLREALSDHYGLPPECFLVGNGADEVFDLIFKSLLNPGELAAYPGPSYTMYPHYARINAARPLEVPLDESFDLSAESILSTPAQLIVLCTPNNPTGNRFNAPAVETVIRSGRPVVVDEAYAEFCGQNWISRVPDFPNLMVVRTFSKAYGLAGLRVGYVAAHPDLIRVIDRARLPFNVNVVSQALAVAALNEQSFVQKYVSLIRAERPAWSEMLSKRGFRVWPSETNFLFAGMPPGVSRDRFVADLESAGVLVRSLGDHPRLQSSFRITIGTAEDRATLEAALDRVLP